MATKYWVGGNGTWDASTTSNWADSSGGAGGAAAPTAADDVVFDAASNTGTSAFTVTIGTGAVCQDFSTGGAGGALDGVMALAGSAAWTVHGSLTYPAANLTRTYTGTITFAATTSGKTITTNGVTLTGGAVVFDGVGGAWTLGSALTVTGNVTLTSGSVATANFAVTAASIVSSNTNTRSLDLGSSTVTLTGATPIDFAVSTSFSLTAGTSSIVCSGASLTFNGGGLTFYNVSFTTTGVSSKTITGENTFNNFTVASTTGTRETFTFFGANQTINGTLTFGAANQPIRRIRITSNVIGQPRTLTVASVAALADVDFRDIVAAGASAPWSGTRIGDSQGNSGITFDAGVNKFWNLAAGGNWSDNAWALTSGGTVSANNFPLPQDTVIIENTGLTAGNTITVENNWQIGTLDASTRSTAATLALASSFYGNLTLSTSITLSGSTAIIFAGRGNQTITSASRTFTAPVTVESAGVVTLSDNLTINPARTFTLTAGTLDLNNQTLSTGLFNSANSNVRAIAFGTGNITVTGNSGFVFSFSTATNFTYTGTPTVNATYAGATGTRSFRFGAAGATESNAPNINISAGTDSISTIGLRVVNLNFTGFSGTLLNQGATIFGNLTFSAGMTVTGGATITAFAGTSGTQQITTNGVAIDFPLTFDGVGGTFAFQDALTQGSTRNFTITNGTVQLKNGVTSTVGSFVTSGTNQKYLQSTTPGTQATLSQASGTVDASYLTIQDINATGGATWNAFVDQGNIDAGNVDGWNFGISPVIGGTEYTYQLRSFTQPRRF